MEGRALHPERRLQLRHLGLLRQPDRAGGPAPHRVLPGGQRPDRPGLRPQRGSGAARQLRRHRVVPLELSVSGPGLDARCALAPGEPALVLGRDADCPVCLPAPQKNISRRHLGVWNEDNTLHFEVLSATAGIEVDGAAYPPGASGSLAPGQVLVLGDYRISVSFEPDTVVTPPDPWADFEKEAAQLVASVSATQPLEEDP